MRGLSRHLSERTRWKSITSLVVGIGLATGLAAAQAGSLLEPGTTTYLTQLSSETPLEVGPAHTLILDTDDSLFALEAPLINKGVVRWLNATPYGDWSALAIATKSLVNQGRVIVDGYVDVYMDGGLNNQGGLLQIGANSSVSAPSITGGRIHGLSSTSKLNAELKNVTITGQVLARATVGGPLTVFGTLGVASMSLSESTLLRGDGRTFLDHGTIKAAPNASSPQLTIAAGHTFGGTGSISNVAVINQGTLDIQQGEVLNTNKDIVQQGANSQLLVSGTLQAPSIQIQGGVIDLQYTGLVTGDVVVKQGRMVLHNLTDFDFENGKIGAAIEGNLTLSDQSQLEVIVRHGDPLSVLEVWGSASLDGDLIVSFLDGARVPSTFDLYISANSLQGTFRSLHVNGTGNLPWSFVQRRDNGQLTVTITAVPEPETWGLMLGGLGVVAWCLRRRTALHATRH